jgi:hypothetical protein
MSTRKVVWTSLLSLGFLRFNNFRRRLLARTAGLT